MIFRRILLTIAKYLAIFLCLITLLLTTPWGSQLTVVLLNNFDSVAADYKSGSLVRDIELHSLTLQLESLNIAIKGLSTELDFSCVSKKLLCIKVIKADSFSLSETGQQVKNLESPIAAKVTSQQFSMPFAIKADSIKVKASHFLINDTEISVSNLSTGLSIKNSEFKLLQPTVKQLRVLLATKEAQPTSQSTPTIAEVMAQLPQVNLPISLNIQQLSVNEIEVKTKGCQEISCQQWLSVNNKFSATWVNTDINIRQFQTSTADFSISKLEAKAKLIPPYQLSTEFVSELKKVSWWPESANSTQQISLQGSLDNLVFDLASEGSLVLNSQGTVNLIDDNMAFNVTLDAQEIPMPLSLTHYGEPSSLSLVLSGNLQQQVIELTSELNSYGYQNARITLAANHQQGRLNIKALQFDDKGTASQLNLHGNLDILSDEISWQLSAQSTGFSLPEISLKSLTELGKNQEQKDAFAANLPDSITGRLQGKIASKGIWSSQQWSIFVSNTDLLGKINNNALVFKGDIGLNQAGQLKPGKLFVAFNDSELTLQANDAAFWDVHGQLSVASIKRWYPGAYGAVTGKFSVTGEEQNPVITLDSQITQLNWQQWQGDAIDIQGRYQPMNGHELALAVNNDHLNWMDNNKLVTVDDFSLNITGDANQHQIKAKWLGDFTGNISLVGHWDDAFTHWGSTVEQAIFGYQKAKIRNDESFDIDIDLVKQQGIVASHCWRGKGVSACLPSKAVIGSDGNITAKVDLDLSVIDELFLPNDTELISQLQGNIKAVWSDQEPIQANAHLSLSSGFIKVSDDFDEFQLLQWSKGDFSFALKEQTITSIMQLLDPSGNALMDINSTIGINNDYPVNAKIQLNQFNLQPFRSILTEVVNLQGSFTADVAVNGTLNAPMLNGDVTLDKGKLTLIQNANTFDNISSKITILNNQAELQGSFLIDDKQANFVGNIAWQDSLTLDVDLNAETLPLIFPPQLAMNISPNLNFSLVEKTLTISGSIDVLDGSYNIETLPEGTVSFSDDVIIVNEYGQLIESKSSGFDIKTNIRVNIANAFKISGQGLQSKLSGQLQINQQEKQPFQLFGSIQSNDGTFKAYGQNLKIDKGEITFNGPIDNPYFNLRASRYIKAEDITVGIQLTGLADSLDMQLFSSPTMERPEMLSYLVRGRGLDASTDNNAAVVSLLLGYGVSSSEGLFHYLEKVPLVSNIALDTEGDGDKTQATISGYVGERIYLKYGVGVYEPINELTVRMFLLNRFWLEVVSGIEKSTDLYYSFDIE